MSLKMKLTSAIIMFMLAIATLVIGVLAAQTQSINMKGTINFEISDRSLYVKNVRLEDSDGTIIEIKSFMPGYINDGITLSLGTHTVSNTSFKIHFDLINTTQNTYNAVEEVTLSPELSSQGVTASASGQISPTQETDSDGDNYAEIMPTSEPTGTITLTISSTSTQAINLGDITITIEQYIPRNLTEEGFGISGNSITEYTGTATDIVIPSSYKIDETTGDYIEDLDGTGTPITTIGANAFQNKMALTSITIPETVTSIGEYAFAGCTALQTIDLSNSQITSIPDRAFQGNLALTSITIPDTVISIGQYAFNGCTNLLNVNLSETSQLQTIGIFAFQNCSSLTSITIPDGVTSIGNFAFDGCYALAIVYNNSRLGITAGSSSHGDVGYYAKEVVTESNPQVGKIEAIGNLNYYINETTNQKIAFVPAVARDTLTSVTLASDTTEINQYAFGGCTSLQSVDFNNCQITTIPEFAFGSCASLTTITIPEGVKSIGSYAFAVCSSLTTITIPEGVKSIGDWAFLGCTSLTTIVIESQYAYNNATSTSACGYLLEYATTVKVPTSIVNEYENSYLESETNFTPSTDMIGDVEYTVFSKNPQS